jgi:hypothetical protein
MLYYLCCMLADMCATKGLLNCCGSYGMLLCVLEELGGREEDAFGFGY